MQAGGDLAGARAQADNLLAKHPKDAVILHFAGVLACQAGDFTKGAELLSRAFKIRPDDPAIRLNLAKAYLDAGDPASAERISRPGPGAGSFPELFRIRADILKAQGSQWEAISAYEKAVAAQPRDHESWNNLGNLRLATGDLEGALAAFERARAIRPEEAVIHLNLGKALSALGRDREAFRSFEAAYRLAPNEPAVLLEYGQMLRRFGRSAEALQPLAAAARLDRNNAEILISIGLALANLDNRDQAEQAFRLALQADPASAAAYVNLGILLEQANRMEELDALIGQAHAQGLRGGDVAYIEALSLRRQGQLREALALAQTVTPGVIDPTVTAHFIGQIADRLGETFTAFTAFQEMNRAAASSPVGAQFDGWEGRRHVEEEIELVDKGWFSSWPRFSLAAEPPSPAFLVGFLRSGTTLLDTVLMGHPGTHVLEEEPVLAHVDEHLGGLGRLAALGAEEAAQLRARYFNELNRISPPAPGRLVIDKNPLLMLRTPLIHRLFPDAKIILTLRHPCDVVLSCFMQNLQVTQAMACFLDLRNTALFYDAVFRHWERCRSVLPLDVHVVRYEDMVDDVEREVRGLLDFLVLPWDPTVLDHQRTAVERGYIRTPSYAQVTEKIYKRATGRWVRYRPYMEEILPILQPWVEKFGYSLD